MGTWLGVGNDPRYTPSTTFETFPFPEGLTPDIPASAYEVVPGYPDRLLPVDDKAAEVLKKRTLTNLYNARPAWLDHAHRRLDEAVAEAYGWGEDWRGGRLGDDEILARLFALNQARAGRGKRGP